MVVGVPKEIKKAENRVALVPAGVEALAKAGHQVIIETNAGAGSGISDELFAKAGARIAASNLEVFEKAEMVVKVKEPLPSEYQLFREGQIVFTFFHFAPVPDLTQAMLKAKIVGIAYETIEARGRLPLLLPMSEVAGRMSIHAGECSLHKECQGRGVLLGGVPGVEPATVVILGGGVVGTNAAKMAAGTGALVYILDTNLDRLRYLDDIFEGEVKTVMSNRRNIERLVVKADLIIGAVLIPGARAPKLITRDMVCRMKQGAVIVDVAVDQGGCAETTHPTYLDNPTYVVDGIVHYCVANMPGAVAMTSTYALTNATFPYILKLADLGYKKALKDDSGFMKGLNVHLGKLVCRPVAEAQNAEWHPVEL